LSCDATDGGIRFTTDNGRPCRTFCLYSGGKYETLGRYSRRTSRTLGGYTGKNDVNYRPCSNSAGPAKCLHAGGEDVYIG
jgi:hypothetical protein